MTEHLTRTPYELAMLAGGPQRVLDVALAMMVRSERLRVSRARELTVISPVANHPVEQAILDTLGPAGRATVHAVRRHAPRHASITELRMRLIAEGLLRATAPSRLGRVLLGRRSGRTTGQGRRVLRQNRAEQILGPARSWQLTCPNWQLVCPDWRHARDRAPAPASRRFQHVSSQFGGPARPHLGGTLFRPLTRGREPSTSRPCG